MENKDYIAKIEDLTTEQIVDGISKGIVTFDELKKTGEFGFDKQKNVKALLRKKDDDAFAAANTVTALQNYLSIFPFGNHVNEAKTKIQQIQDEENAGERKRLERERMLREIKKDINEYAHDEIINKLSNDDLEYLCSDLGIDAQIIKNYKTPELRFNAIPKSESDIPAGYTDVFFWGIPSSGKTCALAAIFDTMIKKYAMEEPDCKEKFGATYRDSLITQMFNKKDWGYLPGRTIEDKTQYMPFIFYKKGEKSKRKISFFELSGEVFKYFYEVANNSQIIDDDRRNDIKGSFDTLNLLLRSNNQKIHFFFIDYNQETKHTVDRNGLTQSNYLQAAATYFRDNNEIFKKRTDAVYVVITKADEIRGSGSDRATNAKTFLNENFYSFMSVLKNQCERNSVDFKVKLFSIGNVYFKRICKINREYSTDIINDLLKRIKPVNDSKLKNFFNS